MKVIIKNIFYKKLGNQILSVDVDPTGRRIATAGRGILNKFMIKIVIKVRVLVKFVFGMLML